MKNIHPGQRVIAFPQNGSYAEYVVANENLTFVFPHEVDFQAAAACPIVSFTSYNLLANVARIQKGESVLIHAAAGGIGTTAIQLAKLLGARTVIGTIGSETKRKIDLDAGADYVICHQTEDFVEKVNELTNGEGVNIILDSISGTVSERSLNCLAFTVASFISVMLAVKLVTFKRKIYMQVAALYSVLALEPHEKAS